jgi:tRNA pseudouridine13 synthase
MDPLRPLPYLTPELPGVVGRIKTRPEDFEVEEIPAYEPCGSGEHLFLWIEKRDVGAEWFVGEIARRLRVARNEVGIAGLKDRHAVTRQWVSVPAAAESWLPIDGEDITVLAVRRHTNKLRPGHLRGNRFRILIGDAQAAAERIEPILGRVRALGLPNFYGPQRFGRDGETGRFGMALLRKECKHVRSPFVRKLALSAGQSVLFNEYLSRRVADGLLRAVLDGDVMAKWPAGGLFVARDVATEQARFDARELVTAGPIFGRKTFAAAGAAAEREAVVLRDAALPVDAFTRFGKLLQGTRRHNLVYIDDLTAAVEAEGLRLTFTLPAGSYATVLLREVMKAEVQGDEPHIAAVDSQ